jgi:N6-adenosine-specific RNA methylase IME4
MSEDLTAAEDLLLQVGGMQYGTILADPPWQFSNRTGKMAPEHRRLSRYSTMSLQEITELPVAKLALPRAHLYLWVPNALVAEALDVMKHWGFTYKTNIVWYKIRKDGGPDGRGVGFYFRNVTELLLFGTRGNFRTLPPGRRQVNLISSQKREHSRKPDEIFPIIESCSPGPYLELFARGKREGWYQWGNEVEKFPYEENGAEISPNGELLVVQPRLFEKPPDSGPIGDLQDNGTYSTSLHVFPNGSESSEDGHHCQTAPENAEQIGTLPQEHLASAQSGHANDRSSGKRTRKTAS